MKDKKQGIRVLYSFPHKLGADRICYTAWQQVNGLAAAGAKVLVFPGTLQRPVSDESEVRPTLARGPFRIPYRFLGKMRALALHDWIVSRRIERASGRIDIIHTWPLGAMRTLQTARRLGIPTVLERPNAHTKFAYETVRKEYQRLGLAMPNGHEHTYNEEILKLEEREYRLADRLLCPSDFVADTFLRHGFPAGKLARHQYGFDSKVFYPSERPRDRHRGLTMLFVGGCAPRKGLHYALDAWLQSPAHRDGRSLIAGEFIPGYAEKLTPLLAHPSIRVLGHRRDVPVLMRNSDALVLSSIEEGSALVTSEGRGSGCVLLVSEAAGAVCRHMENALMHRVGDVHTLSQHIKWLHEDRALLERLRAASLSTVNQISWAAAGRRLLEVYRETVELFGTGERRKVG